MAPAAPRKPLPKDRFSAAFSTLKTQTYYDPSSRGSVSHAWVDFARLPHLIYTDESRRIRTIAWNPTGHLIATGSQDRTLRIWNPDKPEIKNSTELRGHSGAIEKVAWNPMKEAELASISTDGTCKFWDVRTKSCVHTVSMGARGLSLSWSSDGNMVLLGKGERADEETLLPVSVPSYTTHAPLPQYMQTNQTAFAPTIPGLDVYTVLITTGIGTVKIATYPVDPTPESAASLKVLHTVNAHTSSCVCLELSPTGRYLATGGSDAMVCLWDTTDWVCRRTLDKTVGGVRQVSFSWDGNYIIAGSEEGTGIDVAHVETGEYIHTVPTVAPATCVAWHPSRYWLAYSGDPGGLKIVGGAGGQL